MRLTKDLVIIDLETTAGDSEKGDICEIGAVYICRKSLFILNEFRSLAKPTRDYREPKAMEVHGISEEELQQSPDLNTVITNFEEWALKVMNGQRMGFNLKNVMLGAWGTHFDISVLQNQYKLIKREYPFSYRVFDLKSVVYWEFGKMEKGIGQKGGLQSISNILGIPFSGTHHRALDDVRQSIRILQCLALKRSEE